MTIWLPAWKQDWVMAATLWESWWASSRGARGAYWASGKWILGKGTRFVWNSLRSTLMAPSKRREAVMEDRIWAIRRLRLV